MQFIREEGENGNVSRRSFRLAAGLASVSTLLICIGLLEDIQAMDPSVGLTLWILGAITGLPGFYVLYILREVWKAPKGSMER